jgi:vancomycin aglycone glucosyltransferase
MHKAMAHDPSAEPALPSPAQQHQAGQATVAAQFETIAAAARGCDAIVAAETLQLATRSVAEKLGIAYVFAVFCPTVVPSPHHAPPPMPRPGRTPPAATANNDELWARERAEFNDLFGGALSAHRASAGLGPVSDVLGHMFTDRPWLAADRTLAPWPDPTDQAVFQTGAWILPDERPLSAELETFLRDGEPPVYLGFGSSVRAPQRLSQVMIKAARTLGRRAIVARGWADLSLVDDHPDCLAIDEVNQQALFERVAAVVHHGGAGITTVAARAGAPQVVIPQNYDQHYWAGRVHQLGIGTAHAPGAPTTASLTSALALTLRPEVAARARAVATAVRTDGARVAAQRLMAAGPARSS